MKFSRNRLTKIKNKKDTKKIKILKRFKAKGGINKTNKKRKQSHLKHKTLKYIGGDKANDTKMTPVKNIETNVPITKDTKPVVAPKPIVAPKSDAKPTVASKPDAKPVVAPKPDAKPVVAPKPDAKPVVAPKPDAKPIAPPKPDAATKPVDKPPAAGDGLTLPPKPSDKDIAAKAAAVKAIADKKQSTEKKELDTLKELQIKQEAQIKELQKQLSESKSSTTTSTKSSSTTETNTKTDAKTNVEKPQKDVELKITEKQTSMAKKTVDVSIVVPNDSNVVVKNYAQNTTNEVMQNQ